MILAISSFLLLVVAIGLSASMASLDDMFANNGVDTDAVAYLRARRIKSAALLARAGGPAMDSEMFKQRIVNPFVLGWTDPDGHLHKLRPEADEVMNEAALICSYEDACMSRASQLSNSLSTQAKATQA